MTEYLFFVVLFFFFIAPPCLLHIYMRYAKKQIIWREYFPKLFSALEKKHKQENIITPVLKDLFYLLYKKNPNHLDSLVMGYYTKVQKELEKHNRKDLVKFIEVVFKNGCKDEFIDQYSSKNYKKAWDNYKSALTALNNGDLEPASKFIQNAIILFDKENAHYEQGQCLIICGIIFRLSTMFDAAFFMYKNAKNIFERLKLDAAIAEVLGYFGMLEFLQMHFDEAEKYFEEAITLNKKNKRKIAIADIYNQMALLNLQRENYEKAACFAEMARTINEKNNSKNGEAFSLEILGNLNVAKKRYYTANKLFKRSKILYEKTGNKSGELDVFYSYAQSLFNQQKYEESEKILREIISEEKQHPCCFHVANAYNLLGLIFVNKKDWARAKGLFEQSLHLELKNDRLKAVACDYANIALMEKKLGRKKELEAQIQNAKQYAFECGDDEIIKIISDMF